MNKSFRNIALSALLTVGAFSAITYTSCNKDECKDVVCQNGGTCSGGNCACASGYQGTNCETQTRSTYNGDYKGSGSDNTGNTYSNFTFSFSSVGTSATDMQLVIKNAGGTPFLTFPITLATATTFNITSTTLGAFTYAGSGTISTTSASATINQTGSPALVITFTNLIRQ